MGGLVSPSNKSMKNLVLVGANNSNDKVVRAGSPDNMSKVDSCKSIQLSEKLNNHSVDGRVSPANKQDSKRYVSFYFT